jgi:hypothetical protein
MGEEVGTMQFLEFKGEQIKKIYEKEKEREEKNEKKKKRKRYMRKREKNMSMC